MAKRMATAELIAPFRALAAGVPSLSGASAVTTSSWTMGVISSSSLERIAASTWVATSSGTVRSKQTRASEGSSLVRYSSNQS